MWAEKKNKKQEKKGGGGVHKEGEEDGDDGEVSGYVLQREGWLGFRFFRFFPLARLLHRMSFSPLLILCFAC